MNRLPAPARQGLNDALRRADTAARTGEQTTRWANLEDAHVLSQPAALAHAHVHLKMLRAGWDTHERTENTGQLLRIIVAIPGSCTAAIRPATPDELASPPSSQWLSAPTLRNSSTCSTRWIGHARQSPMGRQEAC